MCACQLIDDKAPSADQTCIRDHSGYRVHASRVCWQMATCDCNCKALHCGRCNSLLDVCLPAGWRPKGAALSACQIMSHLMCTPPHRPHSCWHLSWCQCMCLSTDLPWSWGTGIGNCCTPGLCRAQQAGRKAQLSQIRRGPVSNL
jgi:hypothetical protein